MQNVKSGIFYGSSVNIYSDCLQVYSIELMVNIIRQNWNEDTCLQLGQLLASLQKKIKKNVNPVYAAA